METGGRQIMPNCEGHGADRQTGRVSVLITLVDDAIMAAAHPTRESAMTAAVEFVQDEAETRLSGSLAERYERARRHVVEQGGRMDIIASPIFGGGL